MKKLLILLLATILILGTVVGGITCSNNDNGDNNSTDTTAPAISGVTVSDITATTATISWTTDELATSNIVYNQETHGIGSNTVGETTDTTADKTSHSLTLDGLSSATTYYFQVKSEDAAGNMAVSGELTFATGNLTGTGNIKGRLIYTNGKYAEGECVYIFKQGETSSYDSDSVYFDSYYIFRNVPAGQYEIYTAESYCPFIGFIGDPSTVVTVSEGEETQVETLTQIRSLGVSINDPTIILTKTGCEYYRKEVVEGPNPTFYWEEITTAAYYTVEVWSTYTDVHPQNKEYDETVTASTAEIEWPTNLSTLTYNEFRVDVTAYKADGSVIASNYRLFCVDQCDSD